VALRATYQSFSERVRLPGGVDREGMQAKYEDGLLAAKYQC
jgi:HSP20 family molecular chaperone IbpA